MVSTVGESVEELGQAGGITASSLHCTREWCPVGDWNHLSQGSLACCYTAAIQLLYSCRVEGVLSGAEGNVEFENPDLIAHREILKFAIE